MILRTMHSVDALSNEKTTTLLFDGALQPGELSKIKESLLFVIDKPVLVKIDLQGEEKIQFNFLVLLLSFLKTLKANGKKYEILRLSSILVDSFLLLGIPLDLFNIDLAKIVRT